MQKVKEKSNWKGETIVEIEIERLKAFRNHPFQVRDDDDLEKLKERSLSSKVCKFFDFLSAVKLDRRFCIIFVDSHIIGRASHRLLHQSSERWIYQNKSRLFR